MIGDAALDETCRENDGRDEDLGLLVSPVFQEPSKSTVSIRVDEVRRLDEVGEGIDKIKVKVYEESEGGEER